MSKRIAALLVALSMVGCASVPMGDPAMDAAAKTFTVPPGQAGIYVYRNESMGRAVKMDVSVDGQSIGQTAAHTFLYKAVTPGKHTVVSKAENTDTIEVDLKPGTLAFIWQEVKMGVLSARTKLHVVSEEEGKEAVQDTSLAVAP